MVTRTTGGLTRNAEPRVEVRPGILGGKPVIRGTRIPVYMILDMASAGMGTKQILREYPQLKEEDVAAALEYAATVLKKEEYIPA